MQKTIKKYAERLNNLLSNLVKTDNSFEESFVKELYIEALKISIYEFFKPKKYEILRIFNRGGYPWINVMKNGKEILYKIVPSINMINVMPYYFVDGIDECVDIKEISKESNKVIYVNFYSTYKKAINFENNIKGQVIVGFDKYYYGEIKIGQLEHTGD